MLQREDKDIEHLDHAAKAVTDRSQHHEETGERISICETGKRSIPSTTASSDRRKASSPNFRKLIGSMGCGKYDVGKTRTMVA